MVWEYEGVENEVRFDDVWWSMRHKTKQLSIRITRECEEGHGHVKNVPHVKNSRHKYWFFSINSLAGEER